jgi:hypothetical protein
MITCTRTLTRELGVRELARARRPLVVELRAGGVELRIKTKGSRTWYTVPWIAVWTLGAQIEAARRKADKEARREARRRNL